MCGELLILGKSVIRHTQLNPDLPAELIEEALRKLTASGFLPRPKGKRQQAAKFRLEITLRMIRSNRSIAIP